MTDDSGLEAIDPLIDVRSPGERWADSGRAGFERLRERLAHQGAEGIPLLWMVFVLAIVGAQAYSVLRFGNLEGYVGLRDWWYRLKLLSETAGSPALFGSVVGIVLAVVFVSRTSRLALRLASLTGLWSALTGVLGVVVNFHNSDFASHRGLEGELTGAILYLGYTGLGVVVAIIAWRCSVSDPGSAALS